MSYVIKFLIKKKNSESSRIDFFTRNNIDNLPSYTQHGPYVKLNGI